MTEQDWLTCNNPFKMYNFLDQETPFGLEKRYQVTVRKWRLFTVACARQVTLSDDVACFTCSGTGYMDTEGPFKKCPDCKNGRINRSINAVELGERMADEIVYREEITKIQNQVDRTLPLDSNEWNSSPEVLAGNCLLHPRFGAKRTITNKCLDNKIKADLFREIIGNPFRQYWIDDYASGRPNGNQSIDVAWLRWNNNTPQTMAQTIYEEKRFEDCPILADALEDAGCDNIDILSHLRSNKQHYRGCWVIDLFLGKQ